MIGFVIGRILVTEAALLALPLIVALLYGEAAYPFLIPMALLVLIGLLLGVRRPARTRPLCPGWSGNCGFGVDCRFGLRRPAFCHFRGYSFLCGRLF